MFAVSGTEKVYYYKKQCLRNKGLNYEGKFIFRQNAIYYVIVSFVFRFRTVKVF